MLEYNTERNKLIIKEYGRNVQKMIEYALSIEDYKERTEVAKAIVRVMSQINPDTRNNGNQPKKHSESTDYWCKLWDHLFIISDYKLDVASPFPKPKPDDKSFKAIHPDYHKKKIVYRTYGRNMENIIRKVSEYPVSERMIMSKILANHLKKLYLLYNRDSVDDSLIVKQLNDISDGKLSLPDDFTLDTTRDILRQNQPHKPFTKTTNNSKNNKNNNNKNLKKKKIL